MSKPLLSLTTAVPERQFILIDGERYELSIAEEFGIADLMKMRRIAAKTYTEETATDEEVSELAGALRSFVKAIVRAPDDVLAALSDMQCLQLVQAFTGTATERGQPSPPAAAAKRNGSKP